MVEKPAGTKRLKSGCRLPYKAACFLPDALKRSTHLIKKITLRNVKPDYFSFFLMAV
jgi:hypothetical protein